MRLVLATTLLLPLCEVIKAPLGSSYWRHSTGKQLY
jgi:hypothetical protein